MLLLLLLWANIIPEEVPLRHILKLGIIGLQKGVDVDLEIVHEGNKGCLEDILEKIVLEIYLQKISKSKLIPNDLMRFFFIFFLFPAFISLSLIKKHHC